MALAHSPSIVTSGLVLCLDAGNASKGYNLAQNYFPYSEDITLQTGGWTSTLVNDYNGTGTIGITTANYGIAPDGTQTADRIVLNKGVGTSTTDRSGIRYALSMENRTLSYYIKFLDDTTITGFITSVYPQGSTFSYDTLSNDWYRVKISASTSVTCRIQYTGQTAKNTLDALVWGVQLEDGNNAYDYVKTDGTALTASKTLYDLSGRGNNGTLGIGTSTPTYSAENGGSIVFDGTNDYNELGARANLQSIGSYATIDCWFKSTNLGSSTYSVLVGWGDGNSYYSSFGIGNLGSFSSQESIHLAYNSNVVCYVDEGSTKYHDGNWHHSVVTIGPNNHKIFVDGIEKTLVFDTPTNAYSVPNIFGFSATTNIQIGRQPFTTTPGYFPGYISSVKIYDRALTASEIQQNFNALRGRFGI